MAQAVSLPLLVPFFVTCKILESLQLACTFMDSLTWALFKDLTPLYDIKPQPLLMTLRAPTETEAALLPKPLLASHHVKPQLFS